MPRSVGPSGRKVFGSTKMMPCKHHSVKLPDDGTTTFDRRCNVCKRTYRITVEPAKHLG